MSCGFSSSPPVSEIFAPSASRPGSVESGAPTSPSAPNSGSTKLTEGRVPAAQSVRNCAYGARFVGYFSIVVGMIPVCGRSVK